MKSPLIIFCLLLAVLARGAESSQTSETNSVPPVFSLTLRCTNSILKVGDEIPIEFIITNRGTNDYKYADRTYDRSGRMSEYELVAKTESGEEVRDPRAGARWQWMIGGLFGYRVLKPGQSFSKVIPLNRWALVNEPGRYTVTGHYTAGERFSTNPAVINSEPITVAILPRTESEMDAYIGELSNKIAAIPSVRLVTSRRMPEDVRVTEAVPDPAMCEPASDGFWEAEALLYYVPRSEAIKQALIKTASEHGLQNNMEYLLRQYGVSAEEMKPLIQRSLAPDNPQAWASGAVAAQQFSDDAFSSRLAAIASGTNSGARDQAIYALAANRTDQSVEALKSLLNESDPHIHMTVTNAIQTAYFYRGIWTGTPLKPEDFPSLYHKPY